VHRIKHAPPFRRTSYNGNVCDGIIELPSRAGIRAKHSGAFGGLHSRCQLEQWFECRGVHAEPELEHGQYEQQCGIPLCPVFINKDLHNAWPERDIYGFLLRLRAERGSWTNTTLLLVQEAGLRQDGYCPSSFSSRAFRPIKGKIQFLTLIRRCDTTPNKNACGTVNR